MQGKGPDQWIELAVVAGILQAELLRGLLTAQGIEVMLSQEGAGRAYGLSVGPLGRVSILVPARQQQAAESVLDTYHQSALKDSANSE